jgi:GH35 family endo-1,4-beta-xylanase
VLLGAGAAAPERSRAQTARASALLAQAAADDRAAKDQDRMARLDLRKSRKTLRSARQVTAKAQALLRSRARRYRKRGSAHKRHARRLRRRARRLRRMASAERAPPPAPFTPPRRPAIPLGTALDWSTIQADSRLRDVFLAHFDQVTAENEMKMFALQPMPGVWDFDLADQMVDWARAHGKRVRGHTLVFGGQLPWWIRSRVWTRDELLEVMKDHITAVMQHFSGRVSEWDVVNEAIASDGSFNPNVWYQVIGPDYVDQAFRFARAADPSAKLFYNDAGIDLPDKPHTFGVRDLVAGLRNRGVPIDGVGMQSHVSNRFNAGEAPFAAAMKLFTGLGLDVAVTEMDVALDSGGTLSQKLAVQRQVFSDAAQACRLEPRCTSFSTWGISDRYSWLGQGAAGLMFDENVEPKPAFSAVDDWVHGP